MVQKNLVVAEAFNLAERLLDLKLDYSMDRIPSAAFFRLSLIAIELFETRICSRRVEFPTNIKSLLEGGIEDDANISTH